MSISPDHNGFFHMGNGRPLGDATVTSWLARGRSAIILGELHWDCNSGDTLVTVYKTDDYVYFVVAQSGGWAKKVVHITDLETAPLQWERKGGEK